MFGREGKNSILAHLHGATYLCSRDDPFKFREMGVERRERKRNKKQPSRLWWSKGNTFVLHFICVCVLPYKSLTYNCKKNYNKNTLYGSALSLRPVIKMNQRKKWSPNGALRKRDRKERMRERRAQVSNVWNVRNETKNNRSHSLNKVQVNMNVHTHTHPPPHRPTHTHKSNILSEE